MTAAPAGVDVAGTILDSPLRRRLGVRAPVFQAGMGAGARADLAAAVSNAGGLGVIGGAPLAPAALRTEIRAVQDRTEAPFGVDLLFPPEYVRGAAADDAELQAVLAALPAALREGASEVLALATPGHVAAQVGVCLEEGVPVLVAGLGSPAPFLADARAVGTTVLGLAGTLRQARRLADDGVDAVIASGSEAGGHTGAVGSLPLWASCTDALDVPVVAAGGVADGRTMAVAFVLGCQAVWVGTRFLATAEAAVHPAVKDRVRSMTVDDTMVTRAFSGKTMRVLRNRYVDSWKGREHEALPFPRQLFQNLERGQAALEHGDVDEGAVPVGQGGGLVGGILPAAAVLDELVSEALQVLDRVAAASR